MKDYRNAVEAAGMGRTPQLCQDALIEALAEMFEGKKFNGQQGRKPLNIYKQDLPITDDNDSDVDTDAAASPYVMVRMTGGEIANDKTAQKVEFSLVICAYDEGKDRAGYTKLEYEQLTSPATQAIMQSMSALELQVAMLG